MFHKGQKVVLVAPWDEVGKFYAVKAMVHACGKKRLVLNVRGRPDLCLGREYLPAEKQHGFGRVFVDLPDGEIEAAALALAAEFRADKAAHFARCLAGDHGAGYRRAIQKDVDTLAAAEPDFFWRENR